MKNFLGSFLLAALLVLSINSFAQQIPKWKIGDFKSFVNQSKSEVLVINFWATFCKPCMAEIPGFLEAAKKYPSTKVSFLFISLDLKESYPKAISKTAKKLGIDNFSLAWLNETNADYFCPKVDSSWSGAIPSTLFLNAKTGQRIFKEEEMTENEILQNIESILTSASNQNQP